MPVSVSWPANEPSFSASSTHGFRRGASSARDRGEVHRVGDGAAQQIVGHLLGDLQRDVLLRLGGGRAEMRRADHVGQAEQRAFRRRLGLEHVEGGAGDVAGLQRLGERRLVDQPAARAIDDAHALSSSS